MIQEPEETEDFCYICFESGSAEEPLVQVCRCPTRVHRRCIARWQLYSAGRREEKSCRFCSGALPDWKEVLTPRALPSAIPVLSIYYNNTCCRMRVRPGPDGLQAFLRQLESIVGRDVANVNFVFRCRCPDTGAEVFLQGLQAFEAAMHCACVRAAQRSLQQQQQQQLLLRQQRQQQQQQGLPLPLSQQQQQPHAPWPHPPAQQQQQQQLLLRAPQALGTLPGLPNPAQHAHHAPPTPSQQALEHQPHQVLRRSHELLHHQQLLQQQQQQQQQRLISSSFAGAAGGAARGDFGSAATASSSAHTAESALTTPVRLAMLSGPGNAMGASDLLASAHDSAVFAAAVPGAAAAAPAGGGGGACCAVAATAPAAYLSAAPAPARSVSETRMRTLPLAAELAPLPLSRTPLVPRSVAASDPAVPRVAASTTPVAASVAPAVAAPAAAATPAAVAVAPGAHARRGMPGAVLVTTSGGGGDVSSGVSGGGVPKGGGDWSKSLFPALLSFKGLRSLLRGFGRSGGAASC